MLHITTTYEDMVSSHAAYHHSGWRHGIRGCGDSLHLMDDDAESCSSCEHAFRGYGKSLHLVEHSTNHGRPWRHGVRGCVVSLRRVAHPTGPSYIGYAKVVSEAAANAYNLWTILHITVGHAKVGSGPAANPYNLWTDLHITIAPGDMVSGADVKPYTLYGVNFLSSPPSCGGDSLHLMDHDAYNHGSCKHAFRGCSESLAL